MSTRATIKITSYGEEFFIYRHCDGFRENLEPDIKAAIEKSDCSEAGELASIFLGQNYNVKHDIQDYMVTSCFHGDEENLACVEYDKKERRWELSWV